MEYLLRNTFLYSISLRGGGDLFKSIEYVLIYLLDGLFVEKINNIYLRLLLYLFSGELYKDKTYFQTDSLID